MKNDLAFSLIEKERMQNTDRLDIGNCDLTEIPKEVFSLLELNELVLSNEWWDH